MEPPRVTGNDAMRIWKAQEAYRGQQLLWAPVMAPCVFLTLGALLTGAWVRAVLFLVVPLGVLRLLG